MPANNRKLLRISLCSFTALALLFQPTPGAFSAEFYRYDSIGRVIEVVTVDGKRINYAYDKAGNRISAQTTTLAPYANTDSVTVNANASVTIDPKSNDTDPQGLTFQIVGVGTPSHGVVTFTPSTITYTPVSNYVGADSFTYVVQNSSGYSATGTVLVTVSALAPSATADAISTLSNTSKSFDPRTNDSDPQGQTLSVTAASGASHGTTTFSAAAISYVPAQNYVGSDSFSYTVSNASGKTATALVSVTVQAQNPSAGTYSTTVAANGSLSLDPRTAASDPQGQQLNVTAAGSATHGTVARTGNTILYTPTANYVGADAFSYTVANTSGMTASGTVSVTVSANAPTASSDTVSTPSSTAVTFDPRLNDTDPQSQSLSITSVSGASHGSSTFNSSSITYTPSTNYVGPDTLSYVVTNTSGKTATATVSLTVVARNPVVSNDTVSTPSNQAIGISPLSNDYDPQGQTLAISSTSAPAHGSLSASGNTITYTPTTNYVGADSFTYVAQNNSGKTTSGTVNITVTARSPIANTDSRTTNLNTAFSFDPRTNDTDPQGQTLSIVGVNVPAGRPLTVSYNSGSLSVTPNLGFAGDTDFSYTIANTSGAQANAIVNVHVNASAPIATNDSATTEAGIFKAINVLSNDSDPQGQTPYIVSVGTPSHGTTTYSGGTVYYTPVSGYSGVDSFTYTISNTFGLTSTATVTVTVTAPPVTISAALNSNTWNSDTVLPGGTTKSGNTVVTASGGVGSYTYQWEYVSGGTGISPVSPTSSSTSWKDPNIADVGAETAYWRCKVTDSQGNIGYSNPVGIGFSYVDNR